LLLLRLMFHYYQQSLMFHYYQRNQMFPMM
jgi:hypothetical protein